MALSLSFMYFLPSLLHAKVTCLTFCLWEMPFSSTTWARWPQPDWQVSWKPGCLLWGVFGLIFKSYTFISSSFDRNNIHAICHLYLVFFFFLSTRQVIVIIRHLFHLAKTIETIIKFSMLLHSLCPCLLQWSWTRRRLKVPFNCKDSVILWLLLGIRPHICSWAGGFQKE